MPSNAPLVLVDDRGERLRDDSLRSAFYAGVDAAGLGHLRDGDPPLRFHDLRHSFATRAAGALESLSDVQALLGHAHISTTMRYVHYVPAARETDRLAAASPPATTRIRGMTPHVMPTREIGRLAA